MSDTRAAEALIYNNSYFYVFLSFSFPALGGFSLVFFLFFNFLKGVWDLKGMGDEKTK